MFPEFSASIDQIHLQWITPFVCLCTLLAIGAGCVVLGKVGLRIGTDREWLFGIYAACGLGLLSLFAWVCMSASLFLVLYLGWIISYHE